MWFAKPTAAAIEIGLFSVAVSELIAALFRAAIRRRIPVARVVTS